MNDSIFIKKKVFKRLYPYKKHTKQKKTLHFNTLSTHIFSFCYIFALSKMKDFKKKREKNLPIRKFDLFLHTGDARKLFLSLSNEGYKVNTILPLLATILLFNEIFE